MADERFMAKSSHASREHFADLLSAGKRIKNIDNIVKTKVTISIIDLRLALMPG